MFQSCSSSSSGGKYICELCDDSAFIYKKFFWRSLHRLGMCIIKEWWISVFSFDLYRPFLSNRTPFPSLFYFFLSLSLFQLYSCCFFNVFSIFFGFILYSPFWYHSPPPLFIYPFHYRTLGNYILNFVYLEIMRSF